MKKESKQEVCPVCMGEGELWCAMCGTWGNHRSGSCPEFAHEMEHMPINEESVLFYAFRYALGRTTYAPEVVAEEVMRRITEMRPESKLQMRHEISLAIQLGQAGHKCEVKTWRALEVALR